MLVSSRNLPEATILNCFKKANMSEEGQLSAESFIWLDKNVATSGSFISDTDTIFDISNDVDSNSNDYDSNSDDGINETLPLRRRSLNLEEALTF